MTGALAWRGACFAGSGWWNAGTASHAGQVARAVRSAGCRGMRGEAARRRALVEKEGGGVRARGLGGGRRGGRGGERPGRRGVLVACGVGAGQAGAQAARPPPFELCYLSIKSCRQKFSANFLVAANTEISCASLGSSLLEHYSYLMTYSARTYVQECVLPPREKRTATHTYM